MRQMKKIRGRWKYVFMKLAVISIAGLLLGGCLISPKSSGAAASKDDGRSNAEGQPTETTQSPEEIGLQEIQQLTDGGRYAEALKRIDELIKDSDKPELQERRTLIRQTIDQRKMDLEVNFDIKADEVENITFITPKGGVTQGLIFYPYIGVKDSRKYMLLRVGYQETADKSLFVFTDVKVRTGEDLTKLSFNAMNKMSNVDILGSGLTEMVDITVGSEELTLLNTKIPNSEEALVRFTDITNKASDYTVTPEQRQAIADILEYYDYLEEEE